MRVYAPNGTGVVTGASGARRSTGTFSLSPSESPRSSAAAPALRTVGGIDALMALQGLEDPTERRRRAIERGRSALDALDALKLGLLSGSVDPAALARLKSVATDLAGETGDSGLDALLAQIELRVEVELAKFAARPGGRG